MSLSTSFYVLEELEERKCFSAHLLCTCLLCMSVCVFACTRWRLETTIAALFPGAAVMGYRQTQIFVRALRWHPCGASVAAGWSHLANHDIMLSTGPFPVLCSPSVSPFVSGGTELPVLIGQNFPSSHTLNYSIFFCRIFCRRLSGFPWVIYIHVLP